MIHRSVTRGGKGWFTGPWESAVPVALGYSDVSVDLPHVHAEMFEIYFVARGCSTAIVDGVATELVAGDVLVVEPGETHTMRESSDDYLHFVVQTPFVKGDKSVVESPAGTVEPMSARRLALRVGGR